MAIVQNKIMKLSGKVQHYAWGGEAFIPAWLNVPNTERKPFAEYWMGAHPSASSVLHDEGREIVLYEGIQELPITFLGEKVYNSFGELPYLFKILDVKEMLSIQVHPSKTEAEKGYIAEDEAGVPLSAGHRNYKDKNHKPEVMVALSEFWLLHGFLTEDKLKNVLNNIPAFTGLITIFEREGYKGLYQHVMELPQQQVNGILTPLVLAELQKKKAGTLSKEQPGWWVAKAYEHATLLGDIDRGVFSIYFFNIVRTEPGEAVFQGAGVPHAYLEGQNVELMANSDNVLRGGLTPKHVDVPELLKHTIFEGIVPNVMKGEAAGGEQNYPCPVPDFGISKLALAGDESHTITTTSFEIIVVMEGKLQAKGSANSLSAAKGEAIAIMPNETYTVQPEGNVLAYRAFVPYVS